MILKYVKTLNHFLFKLYFNDIANGTLIIDVFAENYF